MPHGHANVNFPALIQGQGFENVGDETLFWYAPWPEQVSDGVRVASWPRDRLGYFQAFGGSRMRPGQKPHFVSAPVELAGKPARISLNVDGIGEDSNVIVEVLDQRFNVLAGYSAQECTAPTSSGLAQPVAWVGGETVEHDDGPIRLRVNFAGVHPEDTRLYALYATSSGD